jgi:pimeloyl-ACP methyl ester carboxylesterase
MTATTRADLAARIRADRQTWRDLVAAVGSERTEQPGAMGAWSFRDLAGHLAGWRNRRCAQLEAAARGEPEPPPPWPAELVDDDAINAWIRDHDSDRSTEALIAEYDASFERLAAAIEALPEPLFEDPAAFPWTGGRAVREGDFTAHLHEEHEPLVRAWMVQGAGMSSPPIILVPGFWLGAWAWDEVAADLRADGHAVTPLTLPGLESPEADRSAITLSDHVEAICDAVRAAGFPAVLAVHSASGFSGYAASDRIPELIAAMVYVDTAPGKGALDPGFKEVERPLVWEQLAAEENLDGLSEEQLETFRRRAVPVPGGVIREGVELTNDARLDIPSTIVCTGYTSEQYKSYAMDHTPAWLAGLTELHDITWIDLPTSHWPMWSRPRELAQILGDVAKAHAPAT